MSGNNTNVIEIHDQLTILN